MKLLFFTEQRTHTNPFSLLQELVTVSAAWSSVTFPNTAQETKKERRAQLPSTQNCTHTALGKSFQLPKLIKSEKSPNSNSTSGILMVSITSCFTRTSLLFSLQPALREACVMLSGMRQEQEWLCGRDFLMIKSWFHADSHAETCVTLPFPAAE